MQKTKKYDIICQQWKGEVSMSIWRQKEEFNQELYDNIDNFFEKLKGQKKIKDRPGQDIMSYDIFDIIENKEILVIEAGVGIGKSWAYLIPLISASKNKEKFNGFLISTSSIALEEQLEQEVNKVSELLGIDINVTVAKGKNNYLCQKRLDNFLKFKDSKRKYQYLRQKAKQGKMDKKDYEELPSKIWKKINVDMANCTNCLHQNDCKFISTRKQWKESKNIICNHDLLVNILQRDSEDKLVNDPSILIVDEAHTLLEKITNAYKKTISKPALESLIYNIYNQMDIPIEDNLPLIDSINHVFRMISTKAKREYRKSAQEEVDILDKEASGFTCTPKIKETVEELIEQLYDLEVNARSYPSTSRSLLRQISNLKEMRVIFSDLISEDSKNIYWAQFLSNTKEHIELNYVPKNTAEIARQLLSNSNYGKVFTSATLTTKKDDYSYFIKGLGLDQIIGQPLFQEFSQPSPYNYDENALLYCATDVVNPKSKDHQLYLDSLATKVDELVEATGGRSLVLFTSKQDMREVYKRLQKSNHDFNILVQEDGKNAEILKEEFKEDTTSVLLATGSFWEGIDIKGESLEQVIITKLPFPIVEPIIEEKASNYKNGFKEVYLPEMLLKLKQGAGRLIRSESDKGIVSILDSRITDYKESVIDSLPFSNVTNSIEDVTVFTKEKLNHNNSQKTKTLR